jgi:hypothetical protein
VVAETVGLCDQTTVAPEEVDLILAEARIYLRCRQAMPATEPQEETLQLAAGEVGFAVQVRLTDQAQVEGAADGSLETG